LTIEADGIAAVVVVAVPLQDSPRVTQQGGLGMPENVHEAAHVQDPFPAGRLDRWLLARSMTLPE
jgi:hypothetical protein